MAEPDNQQASPEADPSDEVELLEVFRNFITGSHILHYHGVVDAYGHMSLRNPNNPSTFYMSQNQAPALISSMSDIIEYNISDASPIDPDAAPGYSERCIHSEILKRFPAMNVVVHSHCADVLPFCITNVPLKACIHMAGFLDAEGVPVWDIANAYERGETQDLLVRNTRLGASLAAQFSGDRGFPRHKPAYTVVLMRGHGFTTAGRSIEEAVYQSIYTKEAAKAQMSALALNQGYFNGRVGQWSSGSGTAARAGQVAALSAREAVDAWEMNCATVKRPWGLWVREVECVKLYRNECAT
ncbi:arad-like aldolase/epimerase [Saccharata proteae CBS 121410]|uniref:Arad-like aldolase/epimerase n=1 Tax=Saccharata proteae CBS 121410 TaxID=1314787 RepID=A0A9P4HQ69_9PEZI|nr:arad-like aldolase/epimerase [Saccharata proteae CBS 121410]